MNAGPTTLQSILEKIANTSLLQLNRIVPDRSTRRLAKDEAVFAGTSTGGNLVAALAIAKELGPDATVVTVMADTGMKYLSSGLCSVPLI